MTKITQKDVIVDKRRDGSYECSAFVDGRRIHCVYYYYGKRESVRRFVRAQHEGQFTLH